MKEPVITGEAAVHVLQPPLRGPESRKNTAYIKAGGSVLRVESEEKEEVIKFEE